MAHSEYYEGLVKRALEQRPFLKKHPSVDGIIDEIMTMKNKDGDLLKEIPSSWEIRAALKRLKAVS